MGNTIESVKKALSKILDQWKLASRKLNGSKCEEMPLYCVPLGISCENDDFII